MDTYDETQLRMTHFSMYFQVVRSCDSTRDHRTFMRGTDRTDSAVPLSWNEKWKKYSGHKPLTYVSPILDDAFF